MFGNSLKLTADEAVGQPREAGSPGGMPEPHAGPGDPPHGAHPLDWEGALHAAEIRLNEIRTGPGNEDHWVVAMEAAELAAGLCAYGLLAEEVAYQRTRAVVRPVGDQRTGEDRYVRKADKASSPDKAAEQAPG